MTRRASFTAALTLLTLAAPAAARNPVTTTGTTEKLQEDTRMRDLPPVNHQLFIPDADEDIRVTSVVNLFPLDPGLFGVRKTKKSRGRVSLECLTPTGRRDLGSRTVRGEEDTGALVYTRRVPANLNCDFFLVNWEFLRNLKLPEGLTPSTETAAELVRPGASADCFDSGTLCLNDDRFRVEVEWRDFEGRTGTGIGFPRTDDSGTFFFFNPDNTELLLKVLDGCNFNDHFWVFYAATTNVEFNVTVTDTVTNRSREFSNPLGQPADAVVDTRAFATCP
ncbi:MAG: hypothetical protein R3325_04465 [Thermoanaerobaculia bacterium]|nr:hypothetical protein [Thermoanaerobaculia bacterium]